jgi:hypothetical protein
VKKFYFVVALAALLFAPSVNAATSQSLRAYTDTMAKKYNVSAIKLKTTINCESGFRQSARGSSGEIGVAQYMPSTFNWMESMFRAKDLNIHNAQHQIELTAWAFAHGYQNHWVCYKISYAPKTLPPAFAAKLRANGWKI